MLMKAGLTKSCHWRHVGQQSGLTPDIDVGDDGEVGLACPMQSAICSYE